MMNKKGRKAYPEHMRAKTTSLRLRPDRLVKFKEIGGTGWLNLQLDKFLYSDGLDQVQTERYNKSLDAAVSALLESYDLDTKG
jgi:hypothetical protein